MPAALALAFGLTGMAIFLAGLALGLLQLAGLGISLALLGLGLVLLWMSVLIYLQLGPRCLTSWRKRRKRRQKLSLLSVTDAEKAAHAKMAINQDSTETLMRSIRGIPYLIQAIQYSLETNLMSQMGQSVIGTSVIHTAPGCTSVLDCDHEEEFLPAPPMISSRTSGPEEQWESTDPNRWTNQQLKVSLNRGDSSFTVFPYSEAHPMPDSIDDVGEVQISTDENQHFGSIQSSLSRVTVSYNSLNQQEIRCIGMTSAFLSKFNNSFKT